MASLLLFGSIAEAAASRRASFEASTVGEILEQANRRFGPAFEELLPVCCIWVNGEEASRSTFLADSDEVAVLPPFSGG